MKKNKNMWDVVPNPCIALAPMADVTDVAFRSMFAKYGKPDIFWTEFVSADGLCSKGRSLVGVDLLFEEDQRPIVAQIFSVNPDNIYEAGMYIKKLGFDGIDINMGCPDRSVEKQGCGADMIRNPENAIAVIKAAKRVGLPLSVKTRIGYKTNEIDTWIKKLLQTNIEALSIHLRTRNELSNTPAHWEYMESIVSLRNQYAPETRILGNGDVCSLADAQEKIEKTGCDGVMIGKGIFGNPWIFNKEKKVVTTKERLEALIEHARAYEEKLSMKRFVVMKKHIKAYVNEFAGAKELRIKLMDHANNADELERYIREFLQDTAT